MAVKTPDTYATATVAYHFPAADTAATQTIAAVAEKKTCVWSITAGFDTNPAAAKKLNVTIGGTEVWAVYIADDTPFHAEFPKGLYGSVNSAVVVTLEADSGGAKGVLSFTYY